MEPDSDLACRIFGAGAVGLSLSYALPLTGLLNGLLTSSAETEQEMVSVERVLEYSAVKPEVSPTYAAQLFAECDSASTTPACGGH